MRWILMTRKLDANDDRAGFMLRWVEGLAARLDHLDVICQEAHDPRLPANVRVHSLGKEAGAGRLAQAWRLSAALGRLVPRADGVLCHMIPRYALFAAPWARLYRRPLLLWYTHRHAGVELRLARRVATQILTAAPGSFPLPDAKVRVMGHGVETDLFPGQSEEAAPPVVIQVARLARIKRQDWLLRAASLAAGREAVGPFEVRLAGGPVENEPGYAAELQQLVATLAPLPQVTFAGPLTREQMAAALNFSAIAVNLSPPGLFDKAALEGMLAGKPTIVTNADFLPLLGDDADWLYLPHDAGDAALAERVARLLALTPQERRALGASLRERAAAAHSLDGLMDRMAKLMHEAARHG